MIRGEALLGIDFRANSYSTGYCDIGHSQQAAESHKVSRLY